MTGMGGGTAGGTAVPEQPMPAVGLPQAQVIRRMLAPVAVGDEPRIGLDRAWRMALGRALRDGGIAGVEVASVRVGRITLAELLEQPEPQSLLAVLEGPGEALGLVALSPAALSAVVEVTTMGRVLPAAPSPRRPTRTDAAMLGPLIDATLRELENALDGIADPGWSGRFHYATFIDDPRPLALLLEDAGFQMLQAVLALGDGAREGAMLLALPSGRRAVPALAGAEVDPVAGFHAQLTEQVSQSPCQMEAVLSRLSLPLAQAMALRPGELLPLSGAALDRIRLEGIDSIPLAEGKLGQNRGMRAVRLAPLAEAQPAASASSPQPGTQMRASG